MSSLITAIGEFGMDFSKLILKQNKDKNISISPISITGSLAMLLYGARNETANQIAKVLHFIEVQSEGTEGSCTAKPEHDALWLIDEGAQCDQPGGIHSQFHALISQFIKPTKDYDLSIANRLFGAKHFDFHPPYVRCIKELYYSGLEQVEFGKETEKTREQINSWVESQTHGKIKELFSTGTLDPNGALVLGNALCFKGKWKIGFKEENTKEAPFWINKNESKNVPMMVQTGMFNYVSLEEPPLNVLDLPFEKENMSMLILLPKNTGDDSYEKLGASITYKKLKELTSTSNMSEQKVMVHLPRFKLEEAYDLKDLLMAMGMTLPFDEINADFSGISQKLFLSQAMHKIFMEVDEVGTERGAASGTEEVEENAASPIKFVVDHAFFFAIVDRLSDLVFFQGLIKNI